MGLFDRFKKSGSGRSPLDEPTVISGSPETPLPRHADAESGIGSEETVVSRSEPTSLSTAPNFHGRPKKSLLTRIYLFFRPSPRHAIPSGPRGRSGGGGRDHFWTEGRPPFERTFIYALLLALAYMGADLVLLANRDKLLPDEAPQAPPKLAGPNNLPRRGDYDRITERNPFNADGLIPDPLRPKDQPKQNMDGPPVPTMLTQLTLVGTLVHINPKRSVATIEIKTPQEKILPFFVGDDIDGLGELTQVERKKAIFRNRQSGRLEYVEIKDNSPILFGRSRGEAKSGEIKQEGNNFSLNREDLNSNLKNINQILQQATAVPNIVPGSGGQIDGFRLIDIQPGSLYEKLGLKKNDVIKGVNGTTVDSANKAVELYNQLKNSSQIALDIDRGGGHETLTYTVK